MKKLISITLILTLVLSLVLSLSSCAETTTGTEAAKILLARERLNENSIRNSISSLPGIASSAIAELPPEQQDEVIEFLSSTRYDSTTTERPTGDYHEWTEFGDNSGGLEAYDTFIHGLNTMAEGIADSIAYLRQNVSITGKWVTTGFIYTRRMMLVVTETAELLFEHDDSYSTDVVNIRYTDENADCVYERYSYYTYDDKGIGHIKDKCIPGKYYESSYTHYASANDELPDFHDYDIAENSRGYWTYIDIDRPSYGESTIDYYIMRDGIASTVTMGLNENGKVYPKSFAAYELDTRAPLVKKEDFTIEIYYSAIKDGLAAVRAYGDAYASIEEREHRGNVGYVPRSNDLVIITDEGEWILPGDTRGMIMYDGAQVNYDSIDALYGGHIKLGYVNNVFDMSAMEAVNLGIDYLESYGITLNTNLDYLGESLALATDIAENFPGLIEWCGVTIENYDDVIEAAAVLDGEFEKYRAEYDEAMTYPKAEGFTLPSNQTFPTIAGFENGTISYADGVITIDGMTLLITDTRLLESGSAYMIKLGAALLDENGNILHANVVPLAGGTASAIFGGEALSLSQSGSYTLPTGLTAGKYQIVAYAATSDGIRVSEMVPVGYYSELDESFESADMDISVSAENDGLYATYSVSRSLTATLDTIKDSYTVEEIEHAIKTVALRHGYTKAGAQLTTESGAAVARDAILTEGTYRMSAYIPSGTGVAEIYIYLTIGN